MLRGKDAPDLRAALVGDRHVAVRAAEDDDGETRRAAVVGKQADAVPGSGRVHDGEAAIVREQPLDEPRAV